jgi:hypothetical protein
MTCDTAQDAIQARRDNALAIADTSQLDEHLLTCGECREFDAALDTIGDVLRSLPVAPMPDHAVAAVWEHAARTRFGGPAVIHRLLSWPAAAVAAALLFVVLVGPLALRPHEPRFSDAQVAQAASEAEYVLALTGRVLARVEQETFDQVIGEHVSPALERIPIRLP